MPSCNWFLKQTLSSIAGQELARAGRERECCIKQLGLATARENFPLFKWLFEKFIKMLIWSYCRARFDVDTLLLRLTRPSASGQLADRLGTQEGLWGDQANRQSFSTTSWKGRRDVVSHVNSAAQRSATQRNSAAHFRNSRLELTQLLRLLAASSAQQQ